MSAPRLYSLEQIRFALNEARYWPPTPAERALDGRFLSTLTGQPVRLRKVKRKARA